MHLIHAVIKTEVVMTQNSLVTVRNGSHRRVLRNRVDASGAEKNFQEGSCVTDAWLEGPQSVFKRTRIPFVDPQERTRGKWREWSHG